MKHQPVKEGQTTTPGISSPTLSEKCAGSLTFPANHITLKMQETGPTVYSPYPRRPERLNLPIRVVSDFFSIMHKLSPTQKKSCTTRSTT